MHLGVYSIGVTHYVCIESKLAYGSTKDASRHFCSICGTKTQKEEAACTKDNMADA
jgi:hypothetical protein